jgi:drug/metabolite transporter (DMT)-like permease
VFLGWLLADEALTVRMLAAAAVIVSGVALITLAPARGATPAVPAEPAAVPAKQSS